MQSQRRLAIVTGGLGFIGKNFSQQLAGKYDRIVIVDKCSKYSDQNFYQKKLNHCELLKSRLKDFELQKHISGFSGVDIFNFAAESHVDDSFDNGPDFVLSNTYDTCVLLEQIKSIIDIVRLVHISTDEVYGERLHTPAVETDSLNPTNPYAASKAAADTLVQTYRRCFGLDSVTIRANNIYGPGQHISKLIPKTILYASQNKMFPVHGDGRQVRHFLHTTDFASAIFTLLDQWQTLESRVFNIAGDSEYSVRAILSKIYQSFNLEPSKYIELTSDRPFNDRRYLVNDKAIRALGWMPEVSFDEEVARMCATSDFFIG